MNGQLALPPPRHTLLTTCVWTLERSSLVPFFENVERALGYELRLTRAAFSKHRYDELEEMRNQCGLCAIWELRSDRDKAKHQRQRRKWRKAA